MNEVHIGVFESLPRAGHEFGWFSENPAKLQREAQSIIWFWARHVEALWLPGRNTGDAGLKKNREICQGASEREGKGWYAKQKP